ncbi:MAG TPA: helix-turn-helix transcriptional regulator [Actinocatenispora sp.]
MNARKQGSPATRPFLRRRLGRELASIRVQCGLKSEEAARLAKTAQSTVSRVESGKMAVRVNTVRGILDAYEVVGDRREALLELAEHANIGRAWWHSYRGGPLPEWFEIYVDLEGEADTLNIADVQYVNGLVQTPDYARAVYRSARPDADAAQIDELVQLRMDRQKRLTEGNLDLMLIVDETALLREYGGRKVMQAQYKRLLELAEMPRISIAVLPIDAQAGVVGSFTILDFPAEEDPAVVYIEHNAGALYLEDPSEIRQYARAYGRLQTAALDLKASARRIADMIKET